MKTDFSRRSEEQEIMDDLNCSGEVVNQTLREIAFINRTLGGNHITIRGLEILLKGRKGPFTIADLGCGGGEMLQIIDKWGQKNNITLRLLGLDANPHIIGYTREMIVQRNIQFVAEDVSEAAFFKREFDIITATLFLHHLPSRQLSGLLKQWITQVRIGIVINDLHRHPLAYYSIKLLTQIFSKSSMVKYDAPLSVLRGFSKREWRDILKDAGITKYLIRWRWAFRWEIVIRR